MVQKLNVGIIGAAGAAGQEFIEAIPDEHPDFQIVELYGDSSAGKTIADLNNENKLLIPLRKDLQDMVIQKTPTSISEMNPEIDMYCSALGGKLSKDEVMKIEGMFASQKPTFSTTSAWRYESDVPIFITELNSTLAYLLKEQQSARGWKGFIAPGPNCTTVGPAISLKAMGIPLEEIISVKFSSYQAISGAGRDAVETWLGQRVADTVESDREKRQLDRNVIPYIKDEVGKVKKELKKVLGYDKFSINGQASRVSVENGHTVTMFVNTKNPVDVDDIYDNVVEFNKKCLYDFVGLFSSPAIFVMLSDSVGPQPLLDAELFGGMCTHIGQIEPLDGENGLKYVVLSHNLKKGAAKGSIQVAEELHKQNYL